MRMEDLAKGSMPRLSTRVLPLTASHSNIVSSGIRNFVVNFIIQSSSSEELLKQNKILINKLNLVLVNILKQEWPHNWPSFIPEIVQSCRTNLSICENNMAILRLLSEEVFDYSAEQMTQAKTKNLKSTMCNEFSAIFTLCQEVLVGATSESLLLATLETLLKFLNWIPLGYIFETPIIETLRTRFLPIPVFRNVTLKCLTEIGGLQISGQIHYEEKLVSMFTNVMTTIAEMIPISTNLRSIYPTSPARDQEFIQNLAIFLCNFFTPHVKLIENLPNKDYLVHSHLYLIRISQIDDREIFKICLEYWTKLVAELYEEMQQLPMSDLNPLLSGGAPPPSLLTNYPLRKHMYTEVLSNLRLVMIEGMVRPEEVLIVENDEGEIVREFVKEGDTIQLYKTTRECLVYLTHLDVVDTETIMSEKLARQVDGSEWSWANCNTLCWAIGSISGAMNEETEKRFLVTVIKDLLGLTEMKRGKDNKAVVASNIMYIVGQYPRFLKAHWKFLKTVVNKLFEFMHETHEGKFEHANISTFDTGVQDMACDTFIKIANKCKRHFVALQPGETEPFIEEIVRNMSRITNDLAPQQVHTFYEACGYMISAQGQQNAQERLLQDLMAFPNQAWDQIIAQANINPSILEDQNTVKIIGNVMKTNVSACSSIGPYFYRQLGRPIATKMPRIRGLRTVKKEILKLVDTYVQKANDLTAVNNDIVPPLLDAILGDYSRSVPDARDPEVLNVISTIISKLRTIMEDKVPLIMENVFECTLEMINKDFSEYPEHRVEFFKLLRAINLNCFTALLKLDTRQFKYIIDACLWAAKHDNREVEAAGLNMCIELVNNVNETDSTTATAFFQQFFIPILQDIFFVLTDTDHKAGFKLQTTLLARMFAIAQSDKIQAPLYTDGQAPPGTSNPEFLSDFVSKLLMNAFSHLKPVQIQTFVKGLFQHTGDLTKFKNNVRDFLIQLKEFAGDNTELYLEDRENEAEEARRAEREKYSKVGGLLRPSELDDTDDM
ncbi:Exportin-1 [Drechslerella dactyloides]|uniref:Exportin-1 n=1 Tax=Drechslerella dactyloides TaxID=74499 RepID=A0AAD6NLZ8_DREDA|nr:Exportin-1 [Drechslerella dactyloides]